MVAYYYVYIIYYFAPKYHNFLKTSCTYYNRQNIFSSFCLKVLKVFFLKIPWNWLVVFTSFLAGTLTYFDWNVVMHSFWHRSNTINKLLDAFNKKNAIIKSISRIFWYVLWKKDFVFYGKYSKRIFFREIDTN